MRENYTFTLTHAGKALDNMTLIYDKKNALSKLGIEVKFELDSVSTKDPKQLACVILE